MAEGNIPLPDPTVLTTEQLLREVENATKLLRAELAGYEKDCTEKFQSVRTQFALIERQRVEQKADTEKAVQAALSAAKEAVKEQTASSDKSITKSETAMTEQLKQLTATFTTAISGVDKNYGDLKERWARLETIRQGSQEAATTKGDLQARAIAAGAAFIALCSLIALVISLSTGPG